MLRKETVRYEQQAARRKQPLHVAAKEESDG
jgi:hypothetical protein